MKLRFFARLLDENMWGCWQLRTKAMEWAILSPLASCHLAMGHGLFISNLSIMTLVGKPLQVGIVSCHFGVSPVRPSKQTRQNSAAQVRSAAFSPDGAPEGGSL